MKLCNCFGKLTFGKLILEPSWLVVLYQIAVANSKAMMAIKEDQYSFADLKRFLGIKIKSPAKATNGNLDSMTKAQITM